MPKIEAYPEKITVNDDDEFFIEDSTTKTTKRIKRSTILSSPLPAGCVDNQALDTTAGEIGGASVAWTPEFDKLSGGTLNYSTYSKCGRKVSFKFAYTLTGANVSGNVSFTLPITAEDTTRFVIGNARLSGTYYGPVVSAANGTKGNIYVYNSGVAFLRATELSATVPHTWGEGDYIIVCGEYMANS